MSVFVVIAASLLLTTTSAGAAKAPKTKNSTLPWSYEGLGSELWPSIRKRCAGQYQSPVNIKRDQVNIDPKLGWLKLRNYDGSVQPAIKTGWTLTNNNGITVQLTGNCIGQNSSKIAIDGAGLPHSYEFQNLHFHWGNGENPGAEHLIDGRRYAAELHLVHARNRTAAEKRAQNATMNTETQVLAVMIDVQPRDNPDYEPILSVVKQVPAINETIAIHDKIILKNLLPNHDQNPGEDLAFYRYVGSLTIPECNEGIIWTILQKRVFLSERQLLSLQTVMNGHNKRTSRVDGGGGEHDRLVNNYRLVQPLHGRVITANKLLGVSASVQSRPVGEEDKKSDAGQVQQQQHKTFAKFHGIFQKKQLAAKKLGL